MLDPDELKNRIDGFRTLRGLTQNELAALVAADGFGKHDVGRIERGDLTLTKALRRSIAEHLAVPEQWLVADPLDLAGTEGTQLDRIEQNQHLLLQAAAELLDATRSEGAEPLPLAGELRRLVAGLPPTAPRPTQDEPQVEPGTGTDTG